MRRRSSERRRVPDGVDGVDGRTAAAATPADGVDGVDGRTAAAATPADGVPATPRIEGYQGFQVIGRGATATVYRATQDGFDRAVAIKVLNVDISDRRAQKRFQRERALNGRLSDHPNVVTVLDAGFVDGRYPYLAMELFERGSLVDRLAQHGPFDVPLALHIGIRIAGALESAHRLGILHRDVKPQNVLLSRFGEPALADFGIAAILEMEHSLTTALTPVHAAPEVLEGAEPAATADVYALGSTLHTILTGVAPFAGPVGEGMLAQLLRITTSAPPSIGRSDVPPALVAALHTALAKQPTDRYPTAAAFGAALQRIERDLGLPVTALPIDGDAVDPPVDERVDERPAPSAAAAFPPPAHPAAAGERDDSTERVEVSRAAAPAPSNPAPSNPFSPIPGHEEYDEQVHAVATGHPVEAPTVIGRQRVPAPALAAPTRRRWVLPVTAGAALLLGAGGAVIATSTLRDDRPAAATPDTAPTTPVTLPDDVSAFAPIGLEVSIDDQAVLLTWRDRTDGSRSHVVSTFLPGGATPLQQVVDPGVVLAVVDGVAPDDQACFTVSAVIGIADDGTPVTATSASRCINNATADVVTG